MKDPKIKDAKNKREILTPRRSLWLLLGIFLLSLSLRFICIYQIKTTPLFGFSAMDSSFYHSFALKILEGNVLFYETIYLNFLYPLFIAAIYRIFGQNQIPVLFSHAIMGALICVFMYIICVKAFNRRSIGLLSSFIYACYNVAIFYTAFLLDTILATFLLVSLILMLLYADDKEKSWLWLASGITLGLSMALRGNLLTYIPFLALWIFIRKNRRFRQRVISLILVLMGSLVALAPFSVRNYMMDKSLSPFTVNGGLTFYIGNHHGATGSFVFLEGISNSPVRQVQQSIIKASEETGNKLSPSEASRYWFSKGFKFIRDYPGEFISLIFKKLILFWNHIEVEPNIDFYFSKRYLPIFNFPFFSFAFVGPLALAGIVFALRNRQSNSYLVILAIFAFMVSLLLLFIISRYRFPCAPLLIIMASYALHNFILLLKTKKIKEFAVFLVMFIGFCLMVNINLSWIKSDKGSALPHNNLGNIYSDKKMYTEAIAEYKKAIQIDSNVAEVHNNLANAYSAQGMLADALVEYKKAIELNPYFAEAHNNLGNLYHKTGKLDEAIIEFKKAIELNPAFAEIHNNLGVVYDKSGKPNEAIAEFRKSLELKPDYSEAHNNLGNAYNKIGAFSEAVAEYKKALELNPNLAEAYNSMGIVYSKQEMFEEAVASYKKAIELNPEFAEVHYNLGNVYEKKDMFKESIISYKKAIELNPKLVQAHYSMAIACHKRGMIEDAFIEYKKVLELNPNLAEVYNNLGNIYQNKDMLQEAIAEYKKAIQIKPNYVDVHSNLAMVYVKKGMLQEAVKEFNKALELRPDYAEYHYNLAVCYFYIKNFDEAIYHYDKAVRNGHKGNPKFEEAIKPYRNKEQFINIK